MATGVVPGEPREEPAQGPPRAHPFDAELDVCELDDRLRPGQAWAARAIELSRAHLIFRSRRMCYATRQLLIKVHLIDARPVGLFGQVRACEYAGAGQYRVEIDLMPLPTEADASAWLSA